MHASISTSAFLQIDLPTSTLADKINSDEPCQNRTVAGIKVVIKFHASNGLLNCIQNASSLDQSFIADFRCMNRAAEFSWNLWNDIFSDIFFND